MFPVGIAYFVGLVVSFAVGGALIWTIVGPVVLLAALFLTRWAGDIEAWMVRHVTPIELRRPPTAIERGESFRSQVWTRLIDPTTWTGVLYLLVQFPIGVAAFVTVVVVGAVSASFIGAPFALMFGSEEIDVGFTVLETSTEALWLVPIGVLTLFVGIHVLNIVSAVHASWARLMLGSRAQRVPDLTTDRTRVHPRRRRTVGHRCPRWRPTCRPSTFRPPQPTRSRRARSRRLPSVAPPSMTSRPARRRSCS